MKIFGPAPQDNEIAQYVGVDYLKFSIALIEECCKWMKQHDNIAQPLLANIDMLLIIAAKYTTDANLLIRKETIQEWETVFNEWFERCEHKIPKKYRDDIKNSGTNLFKNLAQYGY